MTMVVEAAVLIDENNWPMTGVMGRNVNSTRTDTRLPVVRVAQVLGGLVQVPDGGVAAAATQLRCS